MTPVYYHQRAKMSRPLGEPISLPPASLPTKTILRGRTVTLEPLHPDHAETLYAAVGGDDPNTASIWDYMNDGPYSDLTTFRNAITAKATSTDPFHFAILTAPDNVVVGYLSLMRITPEHLTLEIGNILFSPALQRTTHATEAIYLLLRHAFHDLGYRRVEWKCNALNAPSRRAALRLGFTFEGVFRQHMVVKGRSRDTAWFAMLRNEWEGCVAEALEGWLGEGNFDEEGRQRRRLEDIQKGGVCCEY